MECPRCNGKLKRLRTVNSSAQVIRYNACLECGTRIKTIELYCADYESSVNEARILAIRQQRKAEQLSLNLQTIKSAFQTIQTTLAPAPGPVNEPETASAFPARYTRDFQLRQSR